MDWTFLYFVGFGWLLLAFLWLPAAAGIIAARWRGNSNKIDAFLARHGSLMGSIISTGVTAIGVAAAWIAVQAQIGASNYSTRKQIAAANDATKKQIAVTVETTKIQVEAALATASQQIEEARKQHRLEYLRQYLSQLEPALTWLHKAAREGSSRSLYPSDTEPYKSQLQKDLDDQNSFMGTMPLMPFYDDKGARPAERRDDVVEAIRRYRLALTEPRRPENYGEDEGVKKAREALQEADKWSDDYYAVFRLEQNAREEVKKLEEEIEPHPKRRL